MLDKIKLRHICVFSIQKLMDSKENLVFLGMMGSGKSSIGYLVSKNLKIEIWPDSRLQGDLEKSKISQRTSWINLGSGYGH